MGDPHHSDLRHSSQILVRNGRGEISRCGMTSNAWEVPYMCNLMLRVLRYNRMSHPSYPPASPSSFMLARDLARWLVWHSGAYNPHWPMAAGMTPVACGPLGPPPAPMPRTKSSPGSDARHRPPNVILSFTEYALSFPIYLCLPFSLSLFFRQSLLYDS